MNASLWLAVGLVCAQFGRNQRKCTKDTAAGRAAEVDSGRRRGPLSAKSRT